MDCVVNLVVVVKWWILLKFFGLCTKDVRCWIENVWFKSALTARLHSTSTPGVFLYIFLYNGDHFTLIDWIMMSCSYWKTVFLYIKLKTEAPSTPSVPRSSQFSRKMSFHAKWINFLLIFDWTNIHTNKLLRLLWQAQQRTREVHQHIMPSFFELFYWKCRDNWEFPLRNADFLFKNGRLFCNSRFINTGPHFTHVGHTYTSFAWDIHEEAPIHPGLGTTAKHGQKSSSLGLFRSILGENY